MRLLILGGTAFLSAATAQLALERGHDVTCLARGTTREAPAGARWLTADRDEGATAYAAATGDWDEVVDVARQPRHVRDALAVLGGRAAHWTFVSTVSVYAHHDDPPGLDESADLLPAFAGDGPATGETYGEAKVACENACRQALGERLHISRAGLIAGRGDLSDRYGYWSGRCALNAGDPVLVPDARALRTQVIGVSDLARWLLDAAESAVVGTLNATGDPMCLGDVLDLAMRVSGSAGELVAADPDWLVEHGVDYWVGPESLPLWLPRDYTGFGARSPRAAKDLGMVLAPAEELMAECLAHERELGLDRERRAGLSSHRERELLAEWLASRGPTAG